MAIDPEKAKTVAKELYKLLYERDLKLEEIQIALLHMTAWDMTSLLEGHDVHRVPGHLWNYGRALESYVTEVLKKRYPERF